MADFPKNSLDQWRTLIAVVEAGGYAQAADQLHKSQSTLTYAVQKMERLLGVIRDGNARHRPKAGLSDLPAD